MSNAGAKLGLPRWIVTCLPLLIGVPLAGWACWDAYRDGLHFVQGLHGFKWILTWGQVGVVLLLSAIVALFALLTRKRPVAERGRVLPWLVLLVGLALPVFGLVLMPKFFYAGRSRAYARIDLGRLVDNCRQLEPAPSPQGTPASRMAEPVYSHSASFEALPDFVKQLGPAFVWHADGLVLIQMDGGGVMYHEGLAIAPHMPPKLFARICEENDFQVLAPNRSVCLYRCYDWRIAADAFIGAGKPADP